MVWLRERDLDGPSCVLRVDNASDAAFGATAAPGEDDDASLSVASAARFGARAAVAVEVAGTACADGGYGDRPAEGDGYLMVTDTSGGRTVASFAADLDAAGGRFARAGRSVRVLGTLHLAPEPAEVAP